MQQCARPSLGVNVPACFDGAADTLPFDPEPIAAELKSLPSPPKPDESGAPKKFRKNVINKKNLNCPSSGSSGSKDAPVAVADPEEPCEPDSGDTNPNPKAVPSDPALSPKTLSLFHAIEQVTRKDQMDELDRLVQEKAAKKKEREARVGKPKAKASMKKPASAKAKAASTSKAKSKVKAKSKAKSKAKTKVGEGTSEKDPEETHEMPEEESEDDEPPKKRPRRR